ncbi:Retrovirus-related Pol poly from transposon TNT 1-94 [Paramuricea clavata]|uniref:Retrovirus-related Pol poly from transposon TNT 1-94 n=1 Tax=Paramuricea clavata TaxID=317549 RepID=A0A7D9EW93_PARCT|nr:Retrovirus-related Pol poly from transposon TNT 1-94 [Paramuricea clavata]
MELADGTRRNNVALKRGDAEGSIADENGKYVKAVLKDVLFIPTYPQNIFSVRAATSNGAKVKFSQDKNELVYKDGTTFIIEEHERLYCLNTVNQLNDDSNISSSYDKVSLACNIYKWHEILGHCNFDDIMKLENVVPGMKVVGKVDRSKLECGTCTEGKFANCRNRAPDSRATKPLEMVHTDLAGPISPVSKNGFKYCIAFTDDFSGAIFVYFLRNKTDTLLATEKFLADCAPYGQVKCLRSDNDTEFMNGDFQDLLRKRAIKHETSCPNSPHQNGTAESMTGRKPDLSKMWVFGSECYIYNYDYKKLDPRCVKGVFVGYDKNSPAHFVYHPQCGKVMKHRLVKFIKNTSAEQCTQTEIDDLGLCRKEENGISPNDVQGQEKDFPEPEEIVENLDLGEGPQLGVEDSKEVEDDHEAKV